MPPDAASGNNNSAACIGGGMLSSGSGDAAAAAEITRLPSAAAIQQQGAQEEMQGASRPSLPLLHHSAGAELRGVHEVRGSAAMMMHACMRAPYTWVHDCCNTTRWVSTERLSPHLLSLSCRVTWMRLLTRLSLQKSGLMRAKKTQSMSSDSSGRSSSSVICWCPFRRAAGAACACDCDCTCCTVH